MIEVSEVAKHEEGHAGEPGITEVDVTRQEKNITDKYKELERQTGELTKKEGIYRQNVAKLKEEQEVLAEQEKEIERREENASKREEKLLQREISVKERERAVELREQNEGAAIKKRQVEAKADLEAELAEERVAYLSRLMEQLTQERIAFEAQIAKTEKERKATVDAEIETKRREADAEIQAKIKKAETDLETKIKEEIAGRTKEVALREAKVSAQIADNVKKETELNEREEELKLLEEQVAADKGKNDRDRRRLKNKEEELESREEDIAGLVNERIADRIVAFDDQLRIKDQALKELREQAKSYLTEQEEIDNFKSNIGEDPTIIENRFRKLKKTIEELRKELAKSPSSGVQEERDRYKDECERQKAFIEDLQRENKTLRQKNQELSDLEMDNIKLESEKQDLDLTVKELQCKNYKYVQKIERLCTKEASLSDREQRIAEINKGYLGKLIGANLPMEMSEVDWLNNIYAQCDVYGIHFPQRILYAFHTALKISDWSSVTVLAGVSGTGKSELPKLYAAFGGMNFINVPVQPSWDSQESMLGFFNSIDNRFEPEPLLRFLVQCTENEDYNPYMSIVLLDEMNLAHVEHYFADFLSKLETRRGTAKKEVPTVEVKLGAGVEPYQLKLERSVLWTGTMNQDETTKSLSDKVLDRGLVINFPRPRELKSRKKMGILEKAVEATNRPMLTKRTWGSWIVREVKLEGEQLKELDKYKKIVEEINNELEHVGRALGHRVWQSIEYYIINYPTVVEEMNGLASGEMSTRLSEAMKIAFEDQIVQKIMPKLRGVETRGRGKENLEKIEAMLEDKGFERLKDDFEIACEQGYGQFIWSSAKYIEADEAEKLGQAESGKAEITQEASVDSE